MITNTFSHVFIFFSRSIQSIKEQKSRSYHDTSIKLKKKIGILFTKNEMITLFVALQAVAQFEWYWYEVIYFLNCCARSSDRDRINLILSFRIFLFSFFLDFLFFSRVSAKSVTEFAVTRVFYVAVIESIWFRCWIILS